MTAEYADPFAPTIAAQRAMLEKAMTERQRLHDLGMLGMLSGDEALGRVGGAVMRQGESQADYHRDRTDRLEQRAADGQRAWQAARQQAQERTEQAEANRAWQAEQREMQRQFLASQNAATRAARGSSEPLVQVFDPNSGAIMYAPRSQAVGMQAPPRATGNATEGERNAAGFAQRMTEATRLLDANEDRGKQSATTQALGAVPMVGGYMQRGAMSAPQQQYDQASQDWIRAKLRKESGAAIGVQEMAQEYATYFPMPGDGPEVIAQKRQARAVANDGMWQSAGRAMQPDAPQGTPRVLKQAIGAQQQRAADDPLGLR